MNRSRLYKIKQRHASSGFTLIELMILIAIISVIAAIAIPNLLEARKSGNESSAISSLRTIVTTQALFADTDIDGDGTANYADSLEVLERHGLIDDQLGSGQKQGYVFLLQSSPSAVATSWDIQGNPAAPGLTGERSFYVDETGVIRFAICRSAAANDPELGGEEPEVPPGSPDDCPRRNTYRARSVSAFISIANGLFRSRLGTGVNNLVNDQVFVSLVLHGIDANDDGALSFEEALAPNPLSLAQKWAPKLFPDREGRNIGRDTVLTALADRYLDLLRRQLKLGIANETELPTVQIDDLVRQTRTNNDN